MWEREGEGNGPSVFRVLVMVWVVIVLMMFNATFPQSMSDLMWFDDDGVPLYCTLSHGPPSGNWWVVSRGGWWVDRSSALDMSCRHHSPPVGNYDVSVVHRGRFGVSRYDVRLVEPGCAELVGGWLDRLSAEACA